MKHVLIIEDDPDIIELIGIHLKDLDCKITKAMDGFGGLEMASDGSYDLIILDVMLPGLDGIAICKNYVH